MTSLRQGIVTVVLFALLAHLVWLPCQLHAQKLFDLPANCGAVDKAVSSENLKSAAAATEDPEVLLGMAFLARTGDPVRGEISQRVVKLKPDDSRVVAVLSIMMDGADEASVAALLERDPENALGHYLHASLLYEADREQEALAAFQKGAACREMRLYQSVTSAALLEALDALKLQGRDRLCALSWMGTRLFNFGVFYIQPLHTQLGELARHASNQQREEISDALLILAGHLFRTNFDNRWYGRRALESAFRLKAEVAAAEKSAKMHGYAAVTQALVSTMISWPEIAEDRDAMKVAQFLPSRIHRAFGQIGPEEAQMHTVEVPEGDKPAFDKARTEALAAAKALIEAAMVDPDAILGAYLRGVPAREENSDSPWKSQHTDVERVMRKFPEVFKAALRNEEAMRALDEAGRADPTRQNFSRMMQIGQGIILYAFKHDNRFPESIEVLFNNEFLKRPFDTTSLLSGRGYVYVAAGERMPDKSHEIGQFIILYDDQEMKGGYQCIMADGHGEHVPVEKVQEQLKARGK